MTGFKTSLITCEQCGKRIMVRQADVERGQITCSHVGCGAVNTLHTGFHYDEAIVQGIPAVGYLTHIGKPETRYPIQYGQNVIGTADSCTVQVDRFSHNGRCFISRQHCTLTVTFDKWSGQLRYQLQDGVAESEGQERKYSLNGTQLNDQPLLRTEIIDVNSGDVVTLGGVDRFQLTHHVFDSFLLETYKVQLAFNPDRTQ